MKVKYFTVVSPLLLIVVLVSQNTTAAAEIFTEPKWAERPDIYEEDGIEYVDRSDRTPTLRTCF